MNAHAGVVRIQARHAAQAVSGAVQWSPAKSLWWWAMTALALLAGPLLWSWSAFGVFLISSALVLCLGHSLGMHRRLIHASYQCPLWLEYFLVWCGTLVGMAGPLGMMRTHDMRDWAQRQPQCHDYFAHRQPFWHDAWWQLHCDLALSDCPPFAPEARVQHSRFYQWLEKYWMWQQLPVALLLYALGGWGFVVWGVCARVSVCVTGHWLIGHFAHRGGGMYYWVHGASVQGYNVALAQPLQWFTGLISMGECWHNNHHAFPGSARLGLAAGQLDPGWWLLVLLQRAGWVSDLKLPKDLPHRPQVEKILTH
jgi:sn-1 stearoyl-lipid 9-desaturase